MNSINEKQMEFNKNIKINFEGGELTSDAGILLYKEFDEKIGFSDVIHETVHVKDNVNHRQHQNGDVIIQRIYQNAAGYHADNHADDLRHDKAFKAVLEKEVIASQPTISRLNNKLDVDTMKEFQKSNDILLGRIYQYALPTEVIFDIDSTHSDTFGNQYGSAYNSHYGCQGFHPMLMFDGITGDAIKAELRAGNVYTSRQIVRFVAPVLKRYNKDFPAIKLFIRGDSGFALPELYESCEGHCTDYVIRLKANSALYKLSKTLDEELATKCSSNMHDYQVIYGEFMYKAKSWKKSRRVIVKVEKKEGQITYCHTFIVTNITSWAAEDVVEFYCKRGTMENFIKEGKNGFAFGKMSSTDYWANANKLQQMVLAYNLNNWMRRLCFPETMKSDRIETIRIKLIKVAAKIVRSGRYVFFKLCSACPHKSLFFYIMDKIQSLPYPFRA